MDFTYFYGAKKRKKYEQSGFCENCGSPMIRRINMVVKYDKATGKPIYGTGELRCSRDKFCGLWGMPGF